MTNPDWDSLRKLPLVEYEPVSRLSRRESRITRSAVPAIDAHNHLGRWLSETGDWMTPDVTALITLMNAHNVEAIVNLDGMWGDTLEENLDRYDRAHPGRFHTFCQLDWDLLARPGGDDELLDMLRDNVARGARGLKIWKTVGLKYRDESGKLVLPNDARVVEAVRLAGELGIPVLIHTADPVAFFDPLDRHNERLDELLTEKDWWFGDRDRFPPYEALLDALEELVMAAPSTRIVGAHVGSCAEDLDRLERLLRAAPHYSVDIGQRIAELGRQPRRTRALIERFPDRILFGTDIYPITGRQYEQHFRFLESLDEAFDYRPEHPVPPQGRWTVSGLGLDGDVLEKLYRGNALRVLGVSPA
ncbi:amidohydrolase family protein [Streptomyces sp. NPDC056716]|uniref:amidohydrolase family protein n=1 Tax=unclassified Streptomyces TaxID=2593676 RepID=UPI0036B43E3D